MRKSILTKTLMLIAAAILLIAAVCMLFNSPINGIDARVVMYGNTILGLVAMGSVYMHYHGVQHSNPNVLVRSVMLSTIMKLLILAGSAALYLYKAGDNRSIGSIAVLMGLYVVYLFIEVRCTHQLNKVKNGNC